jgi:multidrug efflux pump subunit AcrA (membrane-fusion protein)
MKSLWCVACLLLLSSCACSADKQPAVSTDPLPTSSTEPSTHAAADTDVEGYLQPVDPLEVRLRPKAYTGDLTIVSIAANGASVKSGDALLQIDPEPLNRQLAAAKNDLLVARANVDKAEADAKIAEQSDKLALRQQVDATKQADDAVKWWGTVDGPQLVMQQELGLKVAQAAVDDQQDELNQLKKMYKSEELTNATADIVVKRALRSLDQSKAQLAMTQQQAEKFKSYQYPIEKQKPLDGQISARLALEQLHDAQLQAAVVRKAGLVTAHAALDDAQRKVSDLQSDLENLTFGAPWAGVVAYGSFTQGGFQADPKALRSGEKVVPQQVLLTLYNPAKLAAHVELPEAKFAGLAPGAAATVRSEAFPDVTMQGICEASIRTPSTTGNGPAGYSETVDLQDPSPQLAPGSKVKVHFNSSHEAQSAPTVTP